MSKHGPRTAPGGYQAPTTDAAQISRGRPLRDSTWQIDGARITLKIVPLEGGRPELFELELMLNDPGRGHTEYVPCLVRGQELARQAFALTAQALDAGRWPGQVMLPAGAPLGW